MIEEIITGVLIAEGWDKYTDHPADKGGPTKWGITLQAWGEFLQEHVTALDVRSISEAEARLFYQRKYVIDPGFNLLPAEIIKDVVDAAVHSGVRAATKWLQRSVGAKQDGDLGPLTLAQVKRQASYVICLRINSYRLALFGKLISSDKQLSLARKAGYNLQAEFAAGWNNRVVKHLLELADRHAAG